MDLKTVKNMMGRIVLLSICAMFCMCATTQAETRDSDAVVIKKFSEQNIPADKYAEYLVPVERYTTNGSLYHTKYQNYLIAIARFFIDERKTDVSPHSIGFYFDKRENKVRLYLGVDLIENNIDISGLSYEESVKKIIIDRLRDSIRVLYSAKTVLQEPEVKGIVIGYIWQNNDKNNLFNIWMSKDDIALFFNDNLTFNELIIRSVVTNTDGTIIRIAL